jgi:gas vesicle structural protein
VSVSTIAVAQRNPYLERPPSSSLAEVVDLILDKGLVIDAYVRVSLLGIELLTIDARIVIASVDTYLRFAEAVGRLSLDQERSQPRTLPDLLEDLKPPGKAARRAMQAGKEAVSKVEEGAHKVEQRVRGGGGNGKAEDS